MPPIWKNTTRKLFSVVLFIMLQTRWSLLLSLWMKTSTHLLWKLLHSTIYCAWSGRSKLLKTDFRQQLSNCCDHSNHMETCDSVTCIENKHIYGQISIKACLQFLMWFFCTFIATFVASVNLLWFQCNSVPADVRCLLQFFHIANPSCMKFRTYLKPLQHRGDKSHRNCG